MLLPPAAPLLLVSAIVGPTGVGEGEREMRCGRPVHTTLVGAHHARQLRQCVERSLHLARVC